MKAEVLVTQSCLILCDPVDCSPQAPLSMGSSSQEYWSGLPFPPPGDLPDPGIKPVSPTSLALAAGFFTTSATWEAVLPSVSAPHRPTKKKELFPTSPYTDAFQDIRV